MATGDNFFDNCYDVAKGGNRRSRKNLRRPGRGGVIVKSSQWHGINDNGVTEETTEIIPYSLNKKNRWQLADRHMDLLRENHQDAENSGVNAQVFWFNADISAGRSPRRSVKSCSKISQSGDEEQRFARSTYAQASTLARPANPPRTRKGRKKAGLDDEVKEDEPFQGLSVEFRCIEHQGLSVQHRCIVPSRSPMDLSKSMKNMDSSERKQGAGRKAGYLDRGTLARHQERSRVVELDWTDVPTLSEDVTQHRTELHSLESFLRPAKKMRQRRHRNSTNGSFEDVPSTSTGLGKLDVKYPDRFSIAPPSNLNSTSKQFVSRRANNILCNSYRSVRVYVPARDVAADELRTVYGSAYSECATVPRRFTIDVSELLMEEIVANCGSQAGNREIDALFCAEVQGFWSDDVVSDGDCVLLRVWVNVFTSNASAMVQTPRKVEEMYDYKLCRLIPLLLHEYTHYRAIRNYPRRTRYLSDCVHIPAGIHEAVQPQAVAMSDNSAANEVFSESEFGKQVQRQLTLVEQRTNDLLAVDDPVVMCDACLSDIDLWCVDGLSLARCGGQHWLCEHCWLEYALATTRAKDDAVKCPAFDCSEYVPLQLLRTILPPRQYRLYAGRLRDCQMSRVEDQWVWCPRPECVTAIQLRSEIPAELTVTCAVSCACGFKFCRSCGNHPHWPAPCTTMSRYWEEVKYRGDDLTTRMRIELNKAAAVKRCPHCNNTIEKVEGCNHVICRCGGEFCYSCLSGWSSEHYNCSLKDRKGLEIIPLIDVKKRQAHMNEKWYERCVKHRYAGKAANVKDLRVSLLKKPRVNLPVPVKKMMHRYTSAHEILEFVLVYLCYARYSLPESTRAHLYASYEMANFFAERFNDCCINGSTCSNERLIESYKNMDESVVKLVGAFLRSRALIDLNT